MKKKVLSLVLVLALVFSLVACNDDPKKEINLETKVESQEEQKENVVTPDEKDVASSKTEPEEKLNPETKPEEKVDSENKPEEKKETVNKITSKFVSKEVLNGSAKYVYDNVPNPSVGSIGGEWVVIGLKQSGFDVAADYFDNYYAACSDYVKSKAGVLHEKKYTEYSRVSLSLSIVGKNPTDVEGYNLIEPLNDFSKTVWQGNNGAIWALIAIDANNTECSQRNAYVNEIVSKQLENGGWSISGDVVDLDVTAMALTALSNYSKQDKVKTAISKGFEYIESKYANGFEFSETYAQCIVCYSANNRQLPAGMFDSFISFRQDNGGFSHKKGDAVNQMASEQGLYALAALYRAENGMSKLFKVN